MGEGEGEHWSVTKTRDDCARDPSGCVEPRSCEALSTEDCLCTSEANFLAMASRAKMVTDETCVVLTQGPSSPSAELGFGFGLGVVVTLLVLIWWRP